MEMMLLDRAALLLWPDTPNAGLSGITGRPKPTVRNWRSARRRAPLSVLRELRLLLQARAAECNALWGEIGNEIARREGEPPRRRGFFVLDPLIGQNRQNRLGRRRLREATRRQTVREL
jgi:hypothetical protein